MSDWWFKHSSPEELADVLATSYLERHRSPATAPLRFMDRGIPMLEASLAATMAVREILPAEAAAERAESLLERFRSDLVAAERSEHGVLLLHHQDPALGAERALAREAAPTDVYRAYQHQLHAQLHRLVDDGRFDLTIVAEDRSIISLQDELRRSLHEVHAAVPPQALAGVQIVALGGLSESGKSTAGEYLRVRRGFARLKIGHLLHEAAHWAGIADPYQLDPATRAEVLTDALDRFCAAHHFLKQVSIESLHELAATDALRSILGDQLRVVYLDAPKELRQRRGVAGPEDVTERDAVKNSRRASEIAEIAEIVIDNSGTRLDLERSLDRLVLERMWSRRRLDPVPVNSLGLPVHLEAYLSMVLARLTERAPEMGLFAVTGSGARGKYQHGWSDLDVFIIADQEYIPPIRDVIQELSAELGGVKLGLTVLSEDECRSGAITSRLIYVLILLGSGIIAPLWCRPDLEVAIPDAAAYADAGLRDAVQAAIEIRRQLLRGAPDLRALYKITALLAKLMLYLEDGFGYATDDDAVTAFLQRAPEGFRSAVDEARVNRRQAEALASFVLRSWLSTMTSKGDA
ncbi:nucleotidyltransferase domain-containing protein [Kitasatospora aureofaciens]|nr:nucleotidyltransferase domain-containing protein [Kitasatospora aureofaciens]